MGRYKLYTKSPKPLENIPKRTRQRIIQKKLGPGALVQESITDADNATVETTYDNFGPDNETVDYELDENLLEEEIFHNGKEGLSVESESDADMQSESDVDENESLLQDGEKLYPDSRISFEESNLLVLAFVQRHNLTKEACEDLQELLQFHLPRKIAIPKSKYMLEKLVKEERSQWDRHYYCSECYKYLGTENVSNTCRFCVEIASKAPGNGSDNYFFVSAIEASIVDVLERNQQYLFQAKPSEGLQTLSDIPDGSCYVQMEKKKHDFTCIINTDGIGLFKSSNFQLWPIFISINELPFKIRRRESILVALWFGEQKPNFSTFFDPVVKIFNKLAETGIKWQFQGRSVVSKLFFPLLVCDTPARSAAQGMTQHNGHCSCPWCLHPGETMWINDSSHKTIMPFTKPLPELRSRDNFIQHLKELQQALVSGETVKAHFGVLEASQLLLLKSFNIIDGVAYDYMHSALLGVARYFSTAWFDSKNSSAPFYIGGKVKTVDNLCCNVTVPTTLSRPVRKVSKMAYWKANEWRVWILVGPVLLRNILPEQYRHHFQKFCNAILILLQHSVTQREVEYSEKLLVEFASAVHGLYGNRFYTFNLHITLHAPLIVKRWGPLWCYSAFQFENQNGRISRLLNGTKNVATELSSKLCNETALNKLGHTVLQTKEVKEFFYSMLHHQKYFTTAFKIQNFVMVGASKPYFLSYEEIQQLEKEGISGISEAKFFKKFIYKNLLFDAAKSRVTQFSNCVMAISGSFFMLRGILVATEDDGSCHVILMIAKVTCFAEPRFPHVYKVSSVSECISLRRSDVRIDQSKFVIIRNTDKKISYICKLPNVVELD